jgi:glycosyltransferase involved in cell wall biosynthesis
MLTLDACLPAAQWKDLNHVARPFVRYPHPHPSPGQVWQVDLSHKKAKLSVIIPTSDADRGGYFLKLLAQISAQDFSYFELIVVRGDPRQGRAINIGVSLAKGEYILTLDDDTALPDAGTFSKLVAVMEAHPEIGIAGGNNVIPEDATSFVKNTMRQIPRRSWEPVQTITDSDLAEHPCMIMRTVEMISVGGENELIPRGLDPYLRQVFRERKKRIVVVPDVMYHHLPPNSFLKLVRQYYRNGYQAAGVNRQYPQWVIQTPSHHGSFAPKLTVWSRTVRYLQEIWGSLLKRQWIWVISLCSYLMGFFFGWVAVAGDSRKDQKHREAA